MTAAIVFVIGMQVWPVKPKQVEPQPAPAPAAPAEPPAAADAGSAAADAAGAADAGAGVVATGADAGRPGTAEKDPAADKTPLGEPTDDAAAVSPERKLADKQKQADRDLAREAWRRNRPDISVIGNKTSVLVPIRGSIKGADFKILQKSRTVVVTLPKAVSMVTLRVYNLKHPSFKKLWIDQDEANAQPADGTKLRLILARRTIRRSRSPMTSFASRFAAPNPPRKRPPEKRGEKRSESRAEKHGEKAGEARRTCRRSRRARQRKGLAARSRRAHCVARSQG